MKLLYTLLICLLLSLSMNEICDEVEATKASDCEKLELESGDYRCCFIDAKYTMLGETIIEKQCNGVTKKEYDDIENYIKIEKKFLEAMGAKFDKFEVECNSKYLFASMLLSLLLFLF